VVTEKKLAERARKLPDAMEKESLYSFAEEKIAGSKTDTEDWKALFNLFNATSRDGLVTLLGFSKSEVATRVAEAIENMQLTKTSGEQVSKQRIHEPVVSFAEPERQADEDGDDDGVGEKTPSEISASVASDAASSLRADGESTTTVPSLFSDDAGPGTPQFDTVLIFSIPSVFPKRTSSLQIYMYRIPITALIPLLLRLLVPALRLSLRKSSRPIASRSSLPMSRRPIV